MIIFKKFGGAPISKGHLRLQEQARLPGLILNFIGRVSRAILGA
jgi:hypothetical protein